MLLRIGKKIAAVLVSACLVSSPATAGGIDTQLNKVFDGMSNVTMPGVHETQRRGVLSGGRYTSKVKIYNENLVSFTPPSWKAGCGGIDFFGGSFSFINADQLVQLMRSVAANAAGYAFQLALANVCESCSSMIEALQKKIQELNQHFGNSCQLAQGLVNDVTSGMELKGKVDGSLVENVKGFSDDIFDAFAKPGGKSTRENLEENDPEKLKDLMGNIVWQALNEGGVKSWFASGDDTLMRSIMSITGSVIVGDLVPDPHSPAPDQKTNSITYLEGNLISLQDLIQGGNLKLYNCIEGGDLCTKVNLRNERITGFKQQVEEMLLGNGTSIGIVAKLKSTEQVLTSKEKNFLAYLPSGMGGMFYNIGSLSEDSARLFAQEVAATVAVSMIYDTVLQLFRTARTALTKKESSPYLTKVHDQLNRSRSILGAQYQALIDEHGSIAEKTFYWREVLRNTRAIQYGLPKGAV
ncbi:conjugal transfer protein TraH [Pseudovibrio sp. Ad37]|uniref:conjugal transfer protein TraH n=1 Tax=Pseudovibrio sp. Ad37 TaxID=989422 RepID=UPI0007AE93DB|nr:conjugal transfer protein TraH [Pseudovibrio sp. Ad37]KZL24227.1 Conjugative relaxosome accessory transposon protein [Pseudovibrio sp. Ad37]